MGVSYRHALLLASVARTVVKVFGQCPTCGATNNKHVLGCELSDAIDSVMHGVSLTAACDRVGVEP